MVSFNPRAREGRDAGSSSTTSASSGFNPRAREGRDRAARSRCRCPCSFNPRAREGRDPKAKHLARPKFSFNPRAREGRDAGEPNSFSWYLFQSTRPRGARPLLGLVRRHAVAVSIHAPARGATASVFTMPLLVLFQSTRPRGARPKSIQNHAVVRGFNPRAREGRDHQHCDGFGIVCRFQSTRPRGARREVGVVQIRRQEVSIHAPARGATCSIGCV